MATVLTISPAVATQGDLVAEKTAARAAEAGLIARCAALEAALAAEQTRALAAEAALDKRVALLEGATVVVTNPLTVTDLALTSPTATSLTVTFTEVSDGMGHPAFYVLRYAAGTLNWATGSELLIPGTLIGAKQSFPLSNLAPAMGYQAQVVAYRGTLNLNAIFGAFSAVASGTTGGGVGIITGGLVFASDWPVAGPGLPSGVTGPPRDTWDEYWEFNNGQPVALMSVVAGAGPHGENALKVLQRGSTFAANLQKKNLFPQGTDFYVRYYFKTDDTSPNGDHIATCEFYNYPSLTYLRKYGGSSSWQATMSMYGCDVSTGIYPRTHWHPRSQLQNGVWYRFEYYVHFTTPTAIQVHPRIYDAAGALLYQDADWLQEDYGASGSLSYLGNDRWDLASYYAAGHDFCCVPQYLTAFSVGNNGQAGAADTGLAWYFAKVGISTANWIGA